MKGWWLIPAFAVGVMAGRIGREQPEFPVAQAATVKESPLKRPASRRQGNAVIRSPFEASPKNRAEQFQQWIDALDAGNWRDYLAQATSPDARDREFLKKPSVESQLLLRRMGEIAPQETIRFLTERKLDSCVPEVVEGWAKVAPEEAFGWVIARRSMLGGEGYSAIGKAAAALLPLDPRAVLEHPDFQIQEGVARELGRHAGIQEVSLLLETRWDEVPGDGDRRQNDFRRHEFQNWSAVVVTTMLDSENSNDVVIGWYERVSQRKKLNPAIHDYVEHQLRFRRQIATGQGTK